MRGDPRYRRQPQWESTAPLPRIVEGTISPQTPPPGRSHLKARCAAISAALRAEADVASRPRQSRRLNDLADLVDGLAS